MVDHVVRIIPIGGDKPSGDYRRRSSLDAFYRYYCAIYWLALFRLTDKKNSQCNLKDLHVREPIMYLDYYHLKRKPFQINTDPRFLWLGEKHKEALATLKYGIQDNKGFLLLTGDVGTGKTTLINALLNSLEEKIVVATVPDPSLNRLEFYQYVARAFGIKQPIKDKVEFLQLFGQFLQEEADREQKVLLIIDEAQRLSHDLLEEIRLLSNIERQKTKLLNIFFIGQNELNDILAEPRNRALRQRITVNYHIRTLSEVEVADYIRHRLLIAGSRKTLFSPDAVRQVYLFANGYPRLINVICDRALLTGYVEDAKQIKGKIIKECARELKLPHQRSWFGAVKKLKAGADGRGHQLEEPPVGAAGQEGAGRTWRLYAGVPAVLAAATAFAFFFSPSAQVYRGAEEFADNIVEQSSDGSHRRPEVPQQEAALPALSPEVDPLPQKQLQSARTAAGGKSQSGIIEEPLTEEPLREEPRITASAAAVPVSKVPFAGEAAGESRPTEIEPGGNYLRDQGHAEFLINFPASSNELSPASYQELERLSAIMHENTDIQALVTGYTDISGFYQLNINISESRANMVKGYLVGRGIAPDRIRTLGRGPDDPIAPNDTMEGRQINRRVEVKLIRGS
jgi:general secretion pathway protein A